MHGHQESSEGPSCLSLMLCELGASHSTCLLFPFPVLRPVFSSDVEGHCEDSVC